MGQFAQTFHTAYLLSHRRVLGLAERVTEDQLAWRPGPGAHNIAFELWHLARWADHLQARLPRMSPALREALPPRAEIWLAEAVGQAWGFPAEQLGHDQTGMYMDDNIAVELPLPEKAALLEYLRRAFSAADEAACAVPEAAWPEANVDNPQETVLDVLFAHLMHENRHLGMIECLLGIQSGRGTATV